MRTQLLNQIDASSLSNAKGHLLQIKPASGGGNYLEVDPRSGFYSSQLDRRQCSEWIKILSRIGFLKLFANIKII
ncbi:hypothetical protein BUQ74_13200 [Leptospira weilii serovar Heyan]|nr:hypothetical protein BUQ74_13200 [Leptospira weilii serovar Heyan]